jgi:hypothetical protein
MWRRHRIQRQVGLLLLLMDLISRVPASSPLLFSNSGGLRKGRRFREASRPSGGDGRWAA